MALIAHDPPVEQTLIAPNYTSYFFKWLVFASSLPVSTWRSWFIMSETSCAAVFTKTESSLRLSFLRSTWLLCGCNSWSEEFSSSFSQLLPAISAHVHIISSSGHPHLSSSLSALPSFLCFQVCPEVWQGCHKTVIIKYLAVSWVLSCRATWLNMRSVFPDPYFFFPPLGLFIFLWFWEVVAEGLMICCVCSLPYPSPHYSSPLSAFLSIYMQKVQGVIKIHFLH